LVFAASTLGCAAYEVKTADRDNFTLAKVQASQLMSAVEGEKPPDRSDPALAESLRLARAQEGTLTQILAKKDLKTEEVRALQEALAAYRERLMDIAKASGFKASVAPVETNLSRIEKNLAGFLESREQEFGHNLQTSLNVVGQTLAVVDRVKNHDYDAAPAASDSFGRHLRTSVASLGDSIVALDQSLERELRLRVEALAPDSTQVAALRRELADVDAAILHWLEEVDANLKAVAATGTVPPGFLRADRLAEALETSLGTEAVGDRNEPVGNGLMVAIGFVEELVAGAKAFGVEPRDALVTLSQEFSKVVARYEGLHPEALRVTLAPGAPR
jgi:hypothetical protein